MHGEKRRMLNRHRDTKKVLRFRHGKIFRNQAPILKGAFSPLLEEKQKEKKRKRVLEFLKQQVQLVWRLHGKNLKKCRLKHSNSGSHFSSNRFFGETLLEIKLYQAHNPKKVGDVAIVDLVGKAPTPSENMKKLLWTKIIFLSLLRAHIFTISRRRRVTYNRCYHWRRLGRTTVPDGPNSRMDSIGWIRPFSLRGEGIVDPKLQKKQVIQRICLSVIIHIVVYVFCHYYNLYN